MENKSIWFMGRRSAPGGGAARVLMLLLVLAGCRVPEEPRGERSTALVEASQGPEYSAVVRRTAHGIAHIQAESYASLGYGLGYAFAEDNLCTLAEEVVTLNAERSRYFGPEGSYEYFSNGSGQVNNLKSDFYYQSLKEAGIVEALLARAPPLGPSQQVRELSRGYAAGYNRYLRDTGVENLPDPRCRGAAWVRPLTELDLYRRYHQIVVLASSGFFIEALVNAQPPLPGQLEPPPPLVLEEEAFPVPERLKLGSNAYGLGREATDNGRGMLLANPHFPWLGPERFYQVHLTLPGELDVSGATLPGAPVVFIGHNAQVAWTHTVSYVYRFSPYELTLVPGQPTAYLYEGQVRQMTAQTVTVLARTEQGTLEPRSHTLYRTHFGPMLAYPAASFHWTAARGYALRDANAANFRLMDQFLAMGKARSVHELRQAQDTWQGIPWVHTIAADAAGDASYADASVIPHVTDELIGRCVTSPVGRLVLELARLPVLDGSRSECEWGTDADAVEPGLFGPGRFPRLLRADFVSNSNDNHWLTNPAQPLMGYPFIMGKERSARTLRTRLGLLMLQQRLAGTDGRAGQGFTLEDLQATVLNNRNLSGELLRDEAVAMCQRTPWVVLSDGHVVEVSEACPVLAAWDLRGELDSRGAALWREFWRRAVQATGGPYLVPFDVEEPLHTPRGLASAHPEVLQALGAAVQHLRDKGIALDARLGDIQRNSNGPEPIPVHGCHHLEGCFNPVYDKAVADGTYTDLFHGSSFIMAVSFTDSGPRGRSLLTYSQSSNPASPHASDQTHLYSRKEWVPMRFSEADIAADPHLVKRVLEE